MASSNLFYRIKGIIPQGGHRRPVVFFLVFFLTTLAPVWAQTVSYYMELHFVQRFEWIGDEYALRYEVIIEREEEGEYSRVLREFTDAFFIEVSLPPGKYRCQVIPYDYLEQPVPTSEWVEFEVLSGNEKLLTGEHEINMVNPSDGTGRTKTIILAVPGTEPSGQVETTEENTEGKNQFNMHAGTSWRPFLPISGRHMTPYGVGILLGAVLTTQKSSLSLGAELVASWCAYEAEAGAWMVQQFTIDLNFLAHTPFPDGKTALNFHLGVGFSFLPDIFEDVHANIGVSFLWLLMKNSYLEIGIDYSPFSKGDFGSFRPWIGQNFRL